MKKRCFILLAILLLAGVLFAAGIQDEDYSGAGKSGEFVLLHTNDFHGALLSGGGQGGIAEMAAFVKTVKTVYPYVLLVDAGDINTGSAISNMFDAEPVILGYNMMGYDAVTFGNHEFDGSREKLDKQIKLAGFPFVSANITNQDGSPLGGTQYIVKKYGNISVGIFGLTTLRTLTIASPDNSLVFIDEIEAAQRVVDILRNTENVDIVIALTHLGNVKEHNEHVTSIQLAEEVAGIDIIVDGHSHTFMSAPVKAGNTYIVSAGEQGKYLGYGKIKVRNSRLADFTWAPLSVSADADVAEMLLPYVEKANAGLKEVIGEARETFIFGNRLTRYQETALGNMICDANTWYFRNVNNLNIDFAFHNGGNIRAELPKGPITQEQILTILPFDNYLFIASMIGAQIIELFNFIATIPQGAGGFPQFSADVRYIIDKTKGDGVIKDLEIGGAPVDPEKVYRFCTNDYILGGGDGYAVMMNAEDRFNTSLLLSYVVTEFIKSQGAVTPALDGRLEVIGGVTVE